ncbi:hypothetical protein [Oscillibacter sp.]|uniref:hypothetical protein n=1 Tax=Oscillibacter sp. TaxID=1945593 RepID=UPI003398D86E
MICICFFVFVGVCACTSEFFKIIDRIEWPRRDKRVKCANATAIQNRRQGLNAWWVWPEVSTD